MMKYFIYCRKSSEDEDRQMLSIEAQLSELNSITRAHGITVAETFVESRSAKGPGRPVFNEMIRRIEKGEACGILAWKLDRLARNFDDGGKVIGMLQRGAIREIRTFERSYLPSDNVLMIAVELGMANQYVRDLSVNIQRGIREKVRRGVYSGKAPLGYLNEPKLRTIEPHPVDFEKVKAILHLFAAGRHSLTAIQREMARVGLVGLRSGKPPHISSIDQMLANPFYYGVFLHKGELHQGIHLPMISKATFDRIQEARKDVAKGSKARTREGFDFLGFASCASCGYAITGERHVKKSGLRFFYYRCTRKNKKEPCEGSEFVRQEKFVEEVKRNVRLVSLPEEWKERFLAKVETWEAEEAASRQARIDQLSGELSELKAKINRINSAFANGALEIAEFKELKNPLIPAKAEAEARLAALQRSRANRLEPLRNWIFEASSLEKMVSDGNWAEIKDFLLKVGSNRTLRGQELTVSFAKPWDSLGITRSATLADNGFPNGSLKWWRWRELNHPLKISKCFAGSAASGRGLTVV